MKTMLGLDSISAAGNAATPPPGDLPSTPCFPWMERATGRLAALSRKVSCTSVCFLLALSVAVSRASAEGIPEPSLVMYGVVYDALGVRQTSGTLAVTLLRPGGLPPLKLQANLANINDQFSYVLFIPCETELPGFLVTATDRLKLLATPTNFDRSAVTFNDVKILYTDSTFATLSITSRDRGRLDRVDFSPTGASDLDTNGLLKSWQIANFGRLGVDPNGDPDVDGMTNLAEMQAGTNPNNPGSRLAFVSVTVIPTGGAQVVWSSEPGRRYRLLRSRELLGGYQSLGSPQSATPPANTYVDNTATSEGSYFYRVSLIP